MGAMDLPSRIFLSPHPDDIAYSCYGSLVNPPAPRQDAVFILTVFSTSVRANGQLGQRKCQEEITRVRQLEDATFAKSEGIRLLTLGFPDSSVRRETNMGPEISLEDATKHPKFKAVKEAIAQVIGPAIGHASLYVPLGIGSHIDHRMVREAAKMIAIESGIPGALDGIRYYEDLPYSAFTEEHRIRRLAKQVISPTPTSYVVRLENFWGRKKKAIHNYPSQLSPIVRKALAEHSSSVSNGEFPGAERLWIADTLAVPPVVDIMAWVTWEAAGRIGEYSTLFSNMFSSPAIQASIGRTVLMGPMYKPIAGRRSDPQQDIQIIASTLDCSILYPPKLSSGPGLSKRVQMVIRDVEMRYGITIFYLRDKDQDHQVDRVLFDLSAVLDHKGMYMQTLPGFLRNLKQRINLTVEYDVHQRSDMWEVNDSPLDADLADRSHKVNDTVIGMLLARPVADCLRGIMQPDETAALIATDNLSLPSVYATQMDREIYSSIEGPTIKTLFYAGGLNPIRDLSTGAIVPNVPTLDGVGGFDWEGPMRSLVKLSLENALIDEKNVPILGRYFLDFQPLQEIFNHTDWRILQQAWRPDGVAVASASVRDELLFMNRAFALRGEIPVISPGVSVVPCDMELKERSRRKLISYARNVWEIEDVDADHTIIATQIARAEDSTSFLRAFDALRIFSSQLSSRGHRDTKVLFIIVTSWDVSRAGTGENRSIDELLRKTGGTAFSSGALRVRVINQPQWPALPERNHKPTALTRDDLHRATNLSMCLSLYDTFDTTPLEPVSCGAIAVISTGCGLHRKIQELDYWKENIIVVDYAEEWVESLSEKHEGETHRVLNDLFNVTLEEKREAEQSAHQHLVPCLLNTLPWTSTQRAVKLAGGHRLATELNWEDTFNAPFMSLVHSLFPKA